MILRKPYAFFIKIFKPIHIFMAALLMYLIFETNRLLTFFSKYIYSNDNVVGQSLKEEYVSIFLYIIPIILIVFSLIFLGIMFNKKKPITFYIVNIFVFLFVIIINLYVSSFLGTMEKAIVSIKIVKLNHDLILINMIVEVLMFVFLLIRGLGLNFKKFNFDSDITKIDVSESDKEEFELNINVDLETTKRNRKRKIRQLKYLYKENKLIINCAILFFIFVVSVCFVYFCFNAKNSKSEGVVYNMNKFNFKVNKTIILNEDFNGKKITDNYLIIVDVSLQTNLKSVSLFLKDFKLEVGEANFSVQTKYSSKLVDIGITYNQTVLQQEFTNYIFTFEIPEKYIESDLLFVYNDEGTKTRIELNPQNFIKNEAVTTNKLGENIGFKDTLGDISFTINSFDIKDKFLIKYNYCITKDDCVLSKEYIKASINENFDKHVLKLNVDYSDNSDLNIQNFYDFLENFGTINYKIGDNWYSQTNNFEELKSKKVDNKNNVYIGINSNISNAESVKLMFNIRNSKYEYTLK